jgi:2-C-methyl-D-erythritol 2,4-cyclodiphosphate synthase
MTGIGYDVHRFCLGRPLILGGVQIPHSHGLEGHSDADVLCHAIADAILGAIGEPDIGFWFPPDDAACKDISSLLILEKAMVLVHAAGGTLVNIDSTLIAESPKILPHRDAMKENLARVLGLNLRRVNIKATTNESMGFVGRGEGIAAFAVAQVDINVD